MKNNYLQALFFSSLVLMLAACGSQPPTRYYDLLAVGDDLLAQGLSLAVPTDTTVGIGPVIFPSMLDRYGIVSIAQGTELEVAAFDLWASELDVSFTSVLSEHIARNLGIANVYAQPWDTRFRPQYQYRLNVQQFLGQRGGEVHLKVAWTLVADQGKSKLGSYVTNLSEATSDDSYEAYVATLNELLRKFSVEAAAELSQHLSTEQIQRDTSAQQGGI